jgi:hypothetical protein
MAIPVLNKPPGVWCKHCTPGKGCGYYEHRPQDCRDFRCGYLVNVDLTPEWKPEVSRLVIANHNAQRVNIHVDPGRPDAWRREPYYSTIKDWTRRALAERIQVVVMIGQRSIMLLPDRDVDLGNVSSREVIAISKVPTPAGSRYEILVVKVDTEVGKQMLVGEGLPIPVVAAGGEAAFRRGKPLT